jgi:hypothetical protein
LLLLLLLLQLLLLLLLLLQLLLCSVFNPIGKGKGKGKGGSVSVSVGEVWLICANILTTGLILKLTLRFIFRLVSFLVLIKIAYFNRIQFF